MNKKIFAELKVLLRQRAATIQIDLGIHNALDYVEEWMNLL